MRNTVGVVLSCFGFVGALKNGILVFLFGMIKKYNIISDCYTKAGYFINLASNSLSIFEESKEKEILKNLTSFSLERTY